MKIYTIKELDNIFDEGTYPYISLYNKNDKILIKYNPHTMSIKEGWNRIKKRLKSKGLPDGFYVVKGKGSQDKKITADEFLVQKGKADEKDLDITQLAEKPKETENARSYDAAIDANREIANLRAEVGNLKLELKQKDVRVKELEAIVKEYEEDEEEDDEDIAEGDKVNSGKQYMEDIMDTAVSVLDKYFKLEDQKIALKKQQMNGHAPPVAPQQAPPVQPQQQQRTAPTKEDAHEFAKKMAHLAETDPQEYQMIMQDIEFEEVTDE